MQEQHFSTDIANTSVPSASVTDTSPLEAVGAEEAIAHERTRKHLRHARATPLASIFGSGFLVIVPILNGAVGPYSIVAMAGVCALAYAMGSVIRFNIRHAEPILEAGKASARMAR